MNLRLFLPVVLFLGLAVFLGIGLTKAKDVRKVDSPFIGKPAPVFDLPDLNEPSASVSNANLKGQISLVNVWATWCVGCRQEHEALMDIAANSGIPIIGLNWKDSRAAAQAWLKRFGDPYVATGFDEDGRAGIDWGVYGAPETFLIDADGIVRHKLIGIMTDEVWQEEFMPIIQSLKENGS